MPIYEYQCTECDTEFEEYLKKAGDPIEGCPQCGSTKARKLISRASGVVRDAQTLVDRALKASQEDIRAINSGNEKVLEDIAGPSRDVSN